MHLVTHLLMGWATAECTSLRPREKAVAAWIAVAPDLDGLGLIADKASVAMGRAEPGWYEAFHHVLLHGLFGAAVLALLAAACSTHERLKVALLAFAAVHLHILCDVAGSRGETASDLWPIYYLGPFTENLAILSWQGQWRLDGWQNVSITGVLLIGALIWSIRLGRSPLSAVNRRADQAVVASLRARWRTLRGG